MKIYGCRPKSTCGRARCDSLLPNEPTLPSYLSSFFSFSTLLSFLVVSFTYCCLQKVASRSYTYSKNLPEGNVLSGVICKNCVRKRIKELASWYRKWWKTKLRLPNTLLDMACIDLFSVKCSSCNGRFRNTKPFVEMMVKSSGGDPRVFYVQVLGFTNLPVAKARRRRTE